MPPSAFAAAATKAANVSASASVLGFIFQLPAISGRRVVAAAGESCASRRSTACCFAAAFWKIAARVVVETVSLARVRVVNAASATARCDVRGVARREVMGAIGARALVADIIMFAFRRSAENAEGK